MKVSYNWLKEYLDLSKTNPHDLAEQITLTGIEVDAVHELSSGLENLVVGEVVNCERMDGSDHLNVTRVNIGEDELSQIVCGAPNVNVGQKVIVAKPGAVLPGNVEIKKSTIRDTESNGMICALDELGYGDSVIPKNAEDGIYVLEENAVVGEDARPYIGLDDTVIELDITPNRADALSMRGVAFEAGAILSQTPELTSVNVRADESDQTNDRVKISVENEADTLLYKMRIVKDVTAGESPLWLQRKLMNAGIRPIDSIVDVTNYIMLEYGQPLHAFDYDKVGSNEIFVRRAREGETLITLDEHKRRLSPENLVITDGEKPIALAGVMGGGNSDISEDTRTIAIESAVFESALIRKTAQSLNLRSESSTRFERGVNLATVQEALDHAAKLMTELGGGTVLSGTAEASAKEVKNTDVTTSVRKLNQTIGINLSEAEVENIFDRLGFEHTLVNGKVTVSVPPRRWDITIEADLVEEVARIYGYNQIPSTLPNTESVAGELNDKQRLTRHISRYLEGSGLSQAISYALTTPEKAAQFRLEKAGLITLEYPMSEDHKTLRQSILSGLLDNAEYNRARQMKNGSFYEVGRVFYRQEDSTIPKEENHIAGLLTGSLHEKTWIDEAWPVDFYSAKGIVEGLLETIGLMEPVTYIQHSGYEDLHPGRTAEIRLGEKAIGYIGQVHPLISEKRDLDDTYVFELNLDAIVEAEKNPVVYSSIPKYPGTSRDVALLVDETVTHEDIIRVIEANGGQWLKNVRLFDLYEGENIKAGKKSLAYSLSYVNPEATLKEESVNKDFEQVKMALQNDLKAEVR